MVCEETKKMERAIVNEETIDWERYFLKYIKNNNLSLISKINFRRDESL